MIEWWARGLFAGHCWACGGRLALGDDGPWCGGCAVAVQRAPTEPRPMGDLPVHCLWTYAGAVAPALANAKASGHWPALSAISRDWRALVTSAAPPGPLTLVAVPPHAGRLRERGWHLPDLLAAAVGRGRVWRPLARADAALPRRLDRAQPPRFTWCARAGGGPHGAAVVIIDDVVTTGTTLAAVRALLRDRGVPVAAAVCLADARPDAVEQAAALAALQCG